MWRFPRAVAACLAIVSGILLVPGLAKGQQRPHVTAKRRSTRKLTPKAKKRVAVKTSEPKSQPQEPVRYVPIASVSAFDQKLHQHITGVLRNAGIPCGIEGSVAHGVMVPVEARAKALTILREDAEREGYRIRF